MDRRTLAILAVAVVILMLIVAVAGGGGALERAQALVEAEARQLSVAEKEFEGEQALVLRALADEPDLFRRQGYHETWPQSLDEAAKDLEAARRALDEAKAPLALEAELGEEAIRDLEASLDAARAARVAALAEATRIAGLARQRLDLKRNFEASARRISADYQAIQAADLKSARTLVDGAAVDWPEKKPDLTVRLQTLEGIKLRAQRSWEEAQAAGLKAEADAEIDYEKVIAAAETLRKSRQNIEAGTRKIRELAGELYVSWDKVLADMEVQENGTVTFRHKVRKVTTPVQKGDEPVQPRTEEEWVPVDKAKYLSMEKNLGMVIAHKPAGKYESEATQTVQPPGYAYMAPPGQSNRYGRWETRSGSSFWVWYGQYALFRDLFWGPSYYRPITAGAYRDYDAARSSGRTWYGSDPSGRPRYGSEGTYTAKRYSGSQYQRSGGYKDTLFKKSGGTYRGSRYSSPSSRSSSRRAGRSHSPFGGRSFGGSSRSFGGSRFGFGK